MKVGSAPARRGLPRRRRSAAKRSCARAVIASSARSRYESVLMPRPRLTSRLASGAELLRRVPEVPDGCRRRLAPLELLAVAVDPDHRDVHLQQRRHVGAVAGGDVDPALLAADATPPLAEVRRVGLVAADLLSRYDELELGSQVTTRDAEQLVVDVGDDPDVVAAGEPVHGRVRLPEWLPGSDA